MAGFKTLGQVRPSGTTAVSLYSPPANTDTIVSMIKCCNVSGAAVDVSVFLDDDGSTFDTSTALHFEVELFAGETLEVTGTITLNNSAGAIGVQSSVANAVTFTLFGDEVSTA